jgi:hypothetical protein
MRVLIFTILLGTSAAMPAWADNVILMVNMNYSKEELKALEDVAAKRGQRVEMVPPREILGVTGPMFEERDALEAKIRQIHPDWTQFQMQSVLSEIMRKGSAYNREPDIADSFASEMDALRDAAAAVSQQEDRYGSIADQLNAKADELKNAGDSVDSIAFSSHSDGANLTGETSNRLSSSDLYHLKADHPEIFDSPRHVLLLGCYNLTDTNRAHWRYDLFRNASMLAGFGIRAPSRHDPLSARFIRDTMNTADDLDQKMVANDGPLSTGLLEKTFRALRSFTNKRYPGVVDYCGGLIEGIPGGGEESCHEQWQTFFKQDDEIEPDYLDLKTLNKDPPAVDDGTGLRAFYTMLQNICPAYKDDTLSEREQASNERYRTSVRESVIRLIYWWNVQQNFRTYYENDIARYDSLLSRAGIVTRIPYLDGTVGRVDFVRAYNDLRSEIHRKLSAANDPDSGVDLYQKRALRQAQDQLKLYTPLFYLEGEDSVGDGEATSVAHTLELGGIPFNWIEGATVLRSR